MSTRTFIFVCIGYCGFFLAGFTTGIKQKKESTVFTDCNLTKQTMHKYKNGEMLGRSFTLYEGTVNGKSMICTEY